MFSENLRKLRTRRKLTQREVAEVFGVSQSTYAFYENDKREPSLDILCRIADYYGTTCDDLIGHMIQKVPQTYSDVIQLLIPLMETGLFFFDTGEFTDKIYSDDIGEGGHYLISCDDVAESGVIRSYDGVLKMFCERWQLMMEKREELSFDDELYSAWIEKQLREYERPLPKITNTAEEESTPNHQST